MAYTKQKFTKGQVLKAEHLNSIEDAIKKLDSNIYFIDCDVELESDASGMIDISYLQEGNVGDYLLDADKRLWEIISIESGQIVKLSLAESNQITKNADKIRQLEEDIANLPSGGSGVTTEHSNTLWAILQKVKFYEQVTEEELEAFKTAWGITDTESGGDNEEGGEDTPTLLSIEATYSGGDVTVGTSVDSLSGITVKAHYSDGTTQTVTDYTLSGSIVEGANTITVTYGGLTTTFTVNGIAESSGDNGDSGETTFDNLAESNIYKSGGQYINVTNEELQQLSCDKLYSYQCPRNEYQKKITIRGLFKPDYGMNKFVNEATITSINNGENEIVTKAYDHFNESGYVVFEIDVPKLQEKVQTMIDDGTLDVSKGAPYIQIGQEMHNTDMTRYLLYSWVE